MHSIVPDIRPDRGMAPCHACSGAADRSPVSEPLTLVRVSADQIVYSRYPLRNLAISDQGGTAARRRWRAGAGSALGRPPGTAARRTSQLARSGPGHCQAAGTSRVTWPERTFALTPCLA